MAGYQRSGRKPVINDCPYVCVTELKRSDPDFTPEKCSRLALTVDDKKTVVDVDWAPINFGLVAYFRCQCGTRCRKLWYFHKHWQCRRCTHLPYRSQHQGEYDQAVRRVQVVQAKLGNSNWKNALLPVLDKPKGMREATYQRLLKKGLDSVMVIRKRLAKESLTNPLIRAELAEFDRLAFNAIIQQREVADSSHNHQSV